MESSNSVVPDFDSDKDESLKISLKRIADIPNCCLVILEGYIDTYNSPFFQKQLTKVVAAGFSKILINCKELSYVSSTGLGSFTILLKMVKANGGDIVLSDVQEKVYEVFQILGFSQFFNMKNSLEEALSFLKNGDDTPKSVFPCVLNCPACKKVIQATRAGRFRCTNCKNVITISETASIFLS